MEKKRRPPTDGFTLVETMVVIAIFSIVISSAYMVLISARTNWYTGDVKVELQEDLRQAVNEMRYELSQASPTVVNIGGGGDSVTFQVPVDDIGDNPPGSKMEDTDLPPNGQADYYLADTLNGTATRWGAYLRQEDKTAGGARTGRRLRYILVNDEIRRQVLDGAGAVVEDFLLADDIRSPALNPGLLPIFSLTPDTNAVLINISARKLTIDRYPVDYNLATAVYLRSD